MLGIGPVNIACWRVDCLMSQVYPSFPLGSDSDIDQPFAYKL